MRNGLLIYVFIITIIACTQKPGAIEGKVVDADNKMECMGATIKLYQNGVHKHDASVDFFGKYSIRPLDVGTYDVEIRYLGYKPYKKPGVIVSANQTIVINFEMEVNTELDDSLVEIVYFKHSNCFGGDSNHFIEQKVNNDSLEKNFEKKVSKSEPPLLGKGVVLNKNELGLIPESISIQLDEFIKESKSVATELTGDYVCFHMKECYGRSPLTEDCSVIGTYLILLDDGYIDKYINMREEGNNELIPIPYLSGYFFVFVEKENNKFKFIDAGAAG